MKSRTHFWFFLQAALTAGLAVLIVVLADNALGQVERASEEKALTLARTVVAAIRGVIRHGPDQEGRVHGILEEVARSPEVRGVGIVDREGTPLIGRGTELPRPAVLARARPLLAIGSYIFVAASFEVESGCLASGSCRCAAGGCNCGADESWAVPSGTYRLVLALDRSATQRIQWPIIIVAAIGVAILLALLIVAALLFRALGARERLTRDMALEQQRRQSLESLGLLAAGLAHEVRNPLGAIRGLAQLTHEQAVDPEARGRTALMIEELDRVGERLEEFLGFARKRKTVSAEVDLGAVARKTLTLLGPDAEAAGVALDTEIAEPAVLATGDAAQLGELLINLVLNAIESTAPGGRVTVIVRRADGRPVVEVRDTGRGIASDELPHLFEPYFSTKEHGSGLGLAISRRIAEDHRAVLTLDNAASGGAVARLEFLAATGGPP